MPIRQHIATLTEPERLTDVEEVVQQDLRFRWLEVDDPEGILPIQEK